MTSVAKSPLILPKVSSGDKTAVKNCIDTYGSFVWALARKYTGSLEEAETATEEIFLDIWRYAGRFDPNLIDEAGFIFLVARRQLIKRSARIKRDFFEQQQDFITLQIKGAVTQGAGGLKKSGKPSNPIRERLDFNPRTD